jgi:hypothetical protein
LFVLANISKLLIPGAGEDKKVADKKERSLKWALVIKKSAHWSFKGFKLSPTQEEVQAQLEKERERKAHEEHRRQAQVNQFNFSKGFNKRGKIRVKAKRQMRNRPGGRDTKPDWLKNGLQNGLQQRLLLY